MATHRRGREEGIRFTCKVEFFNASVALDWLSAVAYAIHLTTLYRFRIRFQLDYGSGSLVSRDEAIWNGTPNFFTQFRYHLSYTIELFSLLFIISHINIIIFFTYIISLQLSLYNPTIIFQQFNINNKISTYYHRNSYNIAVVHEDFLEYFPYFLN